MFSSATALNTEHDIVNIANEVEQLHWYFSIQTQIDFVEFLWNKRQVHFRLLLADLQWEHVIYFHHPYALISSYATSQCEGIRGNGLLASGGCRWVSKQSCGKSMRPGLYTQQVITVGVDFTYNRSCVFWTT